ncbi:MAG: nucleotidyltransferase family protein [Chloroflexota bacterium]
MDAILLAAGKGTRMRPLTNDTPKPLLEVQGKPIMSWTLENLAPICERVIVVAKYLKPQIEAYMAEQTIIEDYAIAEQLPEPLGTGHAVQVCQPLLKSDSFIVLNGDDLFDPVALAKMKDVPAAILGVERDDPTAYAAIITNEDGYLEKLHEKPPAGMYPPPVNVNIGAYKLTTQIFDYDIQKSARGEYEITDYVSYLATQVNVHVITAEFWQPVGNPDDLAYAQMIEIPRP